MGLLLVAVITIIHYLAWRFDISLFKYGLHPKDILGLRGIFFAPFIHADLQHLISNIGSLLFVMVLMEIFHDKIHLKVLITIWIGSGLTAWFFARNNYHIGASALVYGYIAFLLTAGFKHRRGFHIIVALTVALFNGGGYIWGIFPWADPIISWELHLTGLVMGILSALFYNTSVNEVHITHIHQNNIADMEIPDEIWEIKKHKLPPPIKNNEEVNGNS